MSRLQVEILLHKVVCVVIILWGRGTDKSTGHDRKNDAHYLNVHYGSHQKGELYRSSQ